MSTSDGTSLVSSLFDSSSVREELNSLKRAILKWEEGFHRRYKYQPTEKDVRKDPIVGTYKEYEKLKAILKTLTPTPSSNTAITVPSQIASKSTSSPSPMPIPSALPPSVPSASPLAAIQSMVKTAASTTQSSASVTPLPSRTNSGGVRVQASLPSKIKYHQPACLPKPSNVQFTVPRDIAAPPASTSTAPPSRPTKQSSNTSDASSATQPRSQSPLTPVASFATTVSSSALLAKPSFLIAGPRSTHQLLAAKRRTSGLMSQFNHSPSLLPRSLSTPSPTVNLQQANTPDAVPDEIEEKTNSYEDSKYEQPSISSSITIKPQPFNSNSESVSHIISRQQQDDDDGDHDNYPNVDMDLEMEIQNEIMHEEELQLQQKPPSSPPVKESTRTLQPQATTPDIIKPSIITSPLASSSPLSPTAVARKPSIMHSTKSLISAPLKPVIAQTTSISDLPATTTATKSSTTHPSQPSSTRNSTTVTAVIKAPIEAITRNKSTAKSKKASQELMEFDPFAFDEADEKVVVAKPAAVEKKAVTKSATVVASKNGATTSRRSKRIRDDESDDEEEYVPTEEERSKNDVERQRLQARMREELEAEDAESHHPDADEIDFVSQEDDEEDSEEEEESEDDDDSDVDEDAPIRAAASAPAAVEPKPRKPRAKKAATTTAEAKPKASKKRATLTDNFVSHNLKRKVRGTARPGKSAKALRKEKWRQSQGFSRWKSKSEYAREKQEQMEQSMYCDVLRPTELKSTLEKQMKNPLLRASEPLVQDHGSDTDEELEALRQMEEKQFGVIRKSAAEQLAQQLDPLSETAIAFRKKREAVEQQTIAAGQAQQFLQSAVDQGSIDEESLRQILRQQFHYQDFRPGQLETIMKVLSRTDSDVPSSPAASKAVRSVLSIMPTGGGKSLIYQFLSLLLPGLTIIVSPLLSLMKDQLEHLPPFIRGAVWSSENTPKSVLELMDDLQHARIKVLFISPEKMLSHAFQKFIRENLLGHADEYKPSLKVQNKPEPKKEAISLVVIDEVHCLAEWSHNFRNSYSRLDRILFDVFQVPRILGLTATATQSTLSQIVHNLRVQTSTVNANASNDEAAPAAAPKISNIVRVPLRRGNLILSVSQVQHENRFKGLVDLLHAAPFKQLKSIIVYVNYKTISESLTKYLKQQGFYSCEYYHAGLPLYQRHKIQSRFMSNQLNIIVATCAFGMGLDKRDIRGVIHFNLPRSFENYIQEIGRAGRDGLTSYCHVMWSSCDMEISRSLLYSNGVDGVQLKRLLERIFDETNRQLPQQYASSAARDEARDVTNVHRHYVALEVEPLRLTMELSEEVVGTILARLERMCPREPWIRFHSSLHNKVQIGFHRTNPKVLAQSNPVIRVLLEQNHWLPRRGKYERLGITFDHERTVGAFDSYQQAQQLQVAQGFASNQAPDFNSMEFQQLKQQKGFLDLDLCEAATDLEMDLHEVHREIVRLRAAGEISVKWEQMSFIVQVLNWPRNELAEGSMDDMHQSHTSRTSLEEIVEELTTYLQRQEEMSSEKLSIMFEALQIATLPSMHCTPIDSVDRGARFDIELIKHQLNAATMTRKQRDNMEGQLQKLQADTQDREQDEFFDLHLVMDAYFDATSPAEFLQQLETQHQEARVDAPLQEMAKRKKQAQLERELDGDLRSFIRTHGDNLNSGRELARIVHGQRAPSHASMSKNAWNASKGGRKAAEDSAGNYEEVASISPFAQHPLWGRYKVLEFPKVLARADELLREWKMGSMDRMIQQHREIDLRRTAKRAKVQTQTIVMPHANTEPPSPTPDESEDIPAEEQNVRIACSDDEGEQEAPAGMSRMEE